MSYNPFGSSEPTPFGGGAPAGPPHGGQHHGGPPGGPPLGGQPQSWEPGEVLQRAFQIFKTHWAPLVLAVVISSLPALVFLGPLAVFGAVTGSTDSLGYRSAGLVLSLVILVVYAYFEVGLTRMWLTAARGEAPDVAQTFTGFDRYPHMLGLYVILAAPPLAFQLLALISGFVGLRILDGLFTFFAGTVQFAIYVLLALGLFYARFLVVEGNMDPVGALKQSWAMTARLRAPLLLFGILCSVILFVSAACCGLPMIAAMPVVMVAGAIVYLRLTGQAPPAMGAGPFGSGFAGGGYPGGSPGGYGGPPPGVG